MKLLYLILLITYQASAQLTIVAPEVDNFSKVDRPGFINDFIELIQKEINHKETIKFEIIPVKRALRKYINKEVNCFVGGDKSLLKLYILNPSPNDFIYSSPYLTIRSKIFSLNDETCDINRLKNKRVATTLQFPINNFINTKELKEFNDLHSFQSAMKMLINNRIDYYVGYLPANYTFNSKIKYCKSKDLIKHNDTIHCHNNNQNKDFINNLNQALNKLRENGKLLELYKKFFPKELNTFYKEVL